MVSAFVLNKLSSRAVAVVVVSPFFVVVFTGRYLYALFLMRF